MKTATAVTGAETTFGRDEIIVSKTDLKGRITYANPVFQRVSGYRLDELLGQPHNIIRHPEFPGGVFRLLWQTIEAGQEIFAYVDNLARDGSHYWVLAHVTPTFGTSGQVVGYHSNRRSPSRTAIAAVSAVYQQMRDIERRHDSAPRAAEASLAYLQQFLAEQGTTYEKFVWDVIASSGELVA